MSARPWTEADLMALAVRDVFQSRVVAMIPHSGWSGSEADILVLTMDGRLIDIEIKISRADLKRDAAKDKWKEFKRYSFDIGAFPPPGQRTHARRIWKHYFLMPAAIWKDGEAAELLPSQECGVLVGNGMPDEFPSIYTARRAIPAKDAYRVPAERYLDIARQCNLRMWSALRENERIRSTQR